jgi:hypothetical protein
MEFETYEDVIDAFENGVGVIQGESLTDYIKRNNIKIKQIDMDPLGDLSRALSSKADGGAIGIEVLFKQKGGAVNSPKSKTIKGQDHMLAYITPNEAKKLEALVGKETMTKEGIPAYPEWDSMYGAESKQSFDKGKAPKGNVNWSGGGGGNNPPTVTTPPPKPPVVKDDKPPWYTPSEFINNPLLNFVNPKSKLGIGLNLFKTFQNFKPKDEDLILSENVTLPSENLLAFTPGSLKDTKLKKLHNQRKEGLMWNEQNEKTYQQLLEEDKESETPTVLSADGGRVGFQSGGWADNLEGEAKGIYDSMTAYGASDAEIQAKLQAQNLWNPDGTTNTEQVTGIINQDIGGRDNTYPGQIVDQTDYSFNKKNYAPGGKLEINPEALGIGFYESGPGKQTLAASKGIDMNAFNQGDFNQKKEMVEKAGLDFNMDTLEKLNQPVETGFIESFMGAAVPNKMKSTVTMPGYEQFQSVNPSEFRNFIDANIEGIPGNLTRQDLANMYEDYNKFFGRRSNYEMARVPGSAENLFGLAFSGMGGIPGVTQLGEFFGSQGDRSMQSKYSVDNAGYGQGTSRDEFGTYTGGKTLMGKTNNYIERMEEDVNFLENDFFGEIMGDTDFENLTESQITAMQKKNGFNFKKLQAYKNRLATEKINADFAKKQAEIEAKKEAERLAAEGKIRLGPNLIQDTNYKSDPALSKIGKEKYTGKGMAFEKTSGGVSGKGTSKERNYGGRKDGGLIAYNRGGLATMFTRRR